MAIATRIKLNLLFTPAIRDGPLVLSKTKKIKPKISIPEHITKGLVAQWQSLAHADYAFKTIVLNVLVAGSSPA